MYRIQGRGGISFNQIEEWFWEDLVAAYADGLREVLERLDDQIARERDTGRFKLRGKRERSITTRVGEVHFQRRYYWDEEESRWVYLLDESLGLEKQERASKGFRAEAVVAAERDRKVGTNPGRGLAGARPGVATGGVIAWPAPGHPAAAGGMEGLPGTLGRAPGMHGGLPGDG